MRSRYKAYNKKGVFFVTSTVVGWHNFLDKQNIYKIIIDEFEFRRKNDSIKVHGFVIMPNHFHAIISSENISRTMQNIKSFTARKIIDYLKSNNNKTELEKLSKDSANNSKSNYQLWQGGYHPQEIKTEKVLIQKIEYIHSNPVRAGLVKEAQQWTYSSIHNHMG